MATACHLPCWCQDGDCGLMFLLDLFSGRLDSENLHSLWIWDWSPFGWCLILCIFRFCVSSEEPCTSLMMVFFSLLESLAYLKTPSVFTFSNQNWPAWALNHFLVSLDRHLSSAFVVVLCPAIPTSSGPCPWYNSGCISSTPARTPPSTVLLSAFLPFSSLFFQNRTILEGGSGKPTSSF